MGLERFGGGGPEGPPNVTEGAGQAPPPTGCLRPYSLIIGLRQGCSLFRVNHSSASRNFRCTACQKQPHPTALQTTGE